MNPGSSRKRAWSSWLLGWALLSRSFASAFAGEDELLALRREVERQREVIQQLTRRLDALENKPAPTSLPQEAESDKFGYHLGVFGDVTYASDQRERDHNAFALRELGLYGTARYGDRLSFLSELTVESEEEGGSAIDLERAQVGYAFGDFLSLRAGKFHTPLGFWNRAYHHGRQLHRRIKHTLLRMIEAARKLAQGDLEQRVRVNTADEFEELAEAFNQMAEGLQRCQKSVEALHQEQLMRADRLVSLGEMACRIAHEIRNPLAGISGAIQVLSEDPSYDNPERLFESIQRQVDRLDQVVRDFLRYSDLPPLELKLTDLHEVIERALSWVFISCKGGPIRTVKDFSHALPPVEVDPNQLEQAFVNIFLNALQAMPGGGELRVTTRLLAEEEEAKIVVSIEDTGPGMKPEVLNHIFAPFFTTKHRGTGLGLPIVHQILTRHRASITASSEPQKGSTFTLTFPCRSSEAKGPEEEAPCCGAAPFLEGESVGHRGKGLLFHRPRELSHAVDSKHSDRG